MQPAAPEHSVLAVLVPEAEALAKPFRDRYDPSAADGMPAHITLLTPFKPPDEIDAAVLARLRECFRHFASFRYCLGSIRRFPDAVLYLAPEPAELFRQLVLAIWDRYPETPPYGGKWPDIVPHLSIAWVRDERLLDRIADDFAKASHARLPIEAIAAQVALTKKRSGRWRSRTSFDLRPE